MDQLKCLYNHRQLVVHWKFFRWSSACAPKKCRHQDHERTGALERKVALDGGIATPISSMQWESSVSMQWSTSLRQEQQAHLQRKSAESQRKAWGQLYQIWNHVALMALVDVSNDRPFCCLTGAIPCRLPFKNVWCAREPNVHRRWTRRIQLWLMDSTTTGDGSKHNKTYYHIWGINIH